jgi:glycosyltransferase involved in cell wall biosynthesis
VIIPAHNEEATIAEVVTESRRGIELLGATGEVLVSASGCTDATADRAIEAGARVVIAPIGKGEAVKQGLRSSTGEIVCLVDGDVQYFGDEPLAAILVRPILHGIADATITDLYWRPLYPQMWLHAFFAPLAGVLFPEMLPKCGSTPWSGQRAALRHLWPAVLPDDFTVDLEILMNWNDRALRLRPILADDWVNPQRPKTDLMEGELKVIVQHALQDDRLDADAVPAVERWFSAAHHLMATYRPDHDDPQAFERLLLSRSTTELHRQLALNARSAHLTGVPQSFPLLDL